MCTYLPYIHLSTFGSEFYIKQHNVSAILELTRLVHVQVNIIGGTVLTHIIIIYIEL